jgi:cell division inhibitor SepF
MSSLFSKALVYLGLVDEAEMDADAPPAQGPQRQAVPAPATENVRSLGPDEGRRVEPPASASRTSARRSDVPSVAGVRPIRPESRADILVIDEFGDAKILADRVRELVPVVLDFRTADEDLVRRVVDFSSGLIYALDGTMSKVGEGLVLVLPPNMTLDETEKRRLASLGAYEERI